MFILQEAPIDIAQARKHCQNPNNGALVTFEGVVRSDEHNGSRVDALLYLAKNEECILEGEKIIKEALALFPLTDTVCIQRIGKLNVGDTAVWIGVWAGHRDEAFKGCRYIIEEIKKRLMIWKKEYFHNGTSEWGLGSRVPIT